MYSQTEHYTAMVVNIQCKYMSFFTSKNQTSKLEKENIEWGIKKETIQKNWQHIYMVHTTKKNKTKTQYVLDTTVRLHTQIT